MDILYGHDANGANDSGPADMVQWLPASETVWTPAADLDGILVPVTRMDVPPQGAARAQEHADSIGSAEEDHTAAS